MTKLSKADVEKLNKSFEITSVCRKDLSDVIGAKKALQFTDEEMKRLVDKMANAYCENSFWQDLEIIADYIIEERR